MGSFQTVFCISVILTVVSGFSLSDVQQRSHRLEGSEFITETVKNFLQCKSLCGRRSLCKSVNYNARTGECTSNFRDTETSLELLLDSVPGSVFAEKRFMPESSGVCNSIPCGDTEVCNQLGSKRRCFSEEIRCGEPPDVPNASKTTFGPTLHSVCHYSCDVGYVMVNGTTTSSCLVTRAWSLTDLICAGEILFIEQQPPPPPPKNPTDYYLKIYALSCSDQNGESRYLKTATSSSVL
ncbi:uncharacterized protein LOC121373651 [Gigantopelta aegis]|uniref:uncharacterized protein LOC121373651 n=1 Tax=Gigantopelta aegis TaxID=1735272 RepID=UPI001B88BD8E|nr:uncharacterized protein LOC121373651 [Gigantopelta aegis]